MVGVHGYASQTYKQLIDAVCYYWRIHPLKAEPSPTQRKGERAECQFITLLPVATII